MEIEQWLDTLSSIYIILPMDEHAFRKWAQLMHKKSDDLSNDAMMAATALTNDMVLVTRNVRDFELMGVSVLTPFEWRQ
jgi:predicted nucleic acid-binding protein